MKSRGRKASSARTRRSESSARRSSRAVRAKPGPRRAERAKPGPRVPTSTYFSKKPARRELQAVHKLVHRATIKALAPTARVVARMPKVAQQKLKKRVNLVSKRIERKITNRNAMPLRVAKPFVHNPVTHGKRVTPPRKHINSNRFTFPKQVCNARAERRATLLAKGLVGAGTKRTDRMKENDRNQPISIIRCK